MKKLAKSYILDKTYYAKGSYVLAMFSAHT